MPGATLQAALTILVAALLVTYVWLRAAPTPLRDPLLALLGAMIVWSAGVVGRFAAGTDAGAYVGMTVTWLGVTAVPPLWLMLAARFARIELFEKRPRLLASFCVPSFLSWLAVATNERHQLFFRSFARDTVPDRGPLFFAALTYSYALVLLGMAFFVLPACRTFSRRAWKHSLLLVTAAVLPTLASALFVAGWLPISYDPTPAAMVGSLAIFTFGVFRYQLLDSLPLARGDVIDHLRDGVLIADPSGILLDANPSALALLGRTRSEVRGARLEDVLGSLAADETALRSFASRFETLEPDALAPRSELRTHEERSIEASPLCLPAPSGGVLGRIALLRDRTEERRIERLLRQSQKLETVGRLVAGVAHEVNNPLAFVRANLRQLERLGALASKRLGTACDPEAEELAELPQIIAECGDGIDRIGRVVDSMRRFTGAPGDEFEAVDVNHVVHEAVRLAGLQRSTAVHVDVRLAPDLPPVHGSGMRLEQVFVNLLVNARHALGENGTGGRLEVTTRLVGDIVEVSVRDDGPGIPEHLRDRIFDPFFTTKGPDAGTGLGLSIAFDIVREHGGVLELRPTRSGACFVAHLPLHAGVDPLAGT